MYEESTLNYKDNLGNIVGCLKKIQNLPSGNRTRETQIIMSGAVKV